MHGKVDRNTGKEDTAEKLERKQELNLKKCETQYGGRGRVKKKTRRGSAE